MDILFCPIKKLYQIAAEADLQKVAALVVSDDFIDISRLGGVGRISFHSFADTTGADGISGEEAEKIAAFVKTLGKDTDTLFCCCDAGVSRSAAMAAAIRHYFGMDEMVVWQDPRCAPNPKVYAALCEALDIPVSRPLIRVLQQINRNAFQDTLGK